MDEPLIDLPAPFDDDAPDGEGDILVIVANGMGGNSATVTIDLTRDTEHYSAWANYEIAEGYDPKAAYRQEVLQDATRFCLMRLPVGLYSINVESNGRKATHSFQLNHGRAANRIVILTQSGILIAEVGALDK